MTAEVQGECPLGPCRANEANVMALCAMRDTRVAELAASLWEVEERASEGSAALDELHAKFSGQMTAALTSVEEQLREGPVARMESAVDGVTGELRGLSAHGKEMEERVEVLAMERRGLEDEKAAMSLLNQELLENSRLLAERTEAEVQDSLSDVSGSSDRTDALLADAARQIQRFQRIIQLRASLAPRAEEAAPEGPTDATAAAISALREQEARAAVARQVELERLEQKALVGKLHQQAEQGAAPPPPACQLPTASKSGVKLPVIGKMRKKVQSHRAAARVKERQVLAQLSAQQAQLAEMHPGEEVRGLEARLAEAQAAHKSAKADIARLKQHVKAAYGASAGTPRRAYETTYSLPTFLSNCDTTPKLSAELSAERTAGETAESNLKAAKLSLGLQETMITDLKAKAANLQQDDHFELIDRAVNAEAKLKATASSAARKEAQIRCLQERLAEAGRAEARRAASEVETEDKASARLRTELRRRETELRNTRQELAAAHEALEMAAQSAEAAAISESHQLRRSDERAARQAKFAEDLIAAVRAVSRLALHASASMRSAAETVGAAAAPPWPASPFGEGEGELGAELSEIAGLVGAVGITPGEVQQLLGINRSCGRRRGSGTAQSQRPAPQAQSLAKVSDALRQLEAALEGMAAEDDLENADPNRGALPPAAGWDAKPVSARLEGLETELRHAEGELSAAAEAQRSAAGATPARRPHEWWVEVDRGVVGKVLAGLPPAWRSGSSTEEEEQELSFQHSSGGHSSAGSWAATAQEMGHDMVAATRDARARLAQRNA
eukprot:jgi/Tetstr1/437955/TSEL_026585.t1